MDLLINNCEGLKMSHYLLEEFRKGESLTDEELIDLRRVLKYYAEYIQKEVTWFSGNLNLIEITLIISGARQYLNSVEDIMKVRGIEHETN